MKYKYFLSVGKVIVVSLVFSGLVGCDKESNGTQHIAYVDMSEILKKSDISKQESERRTKIHDILVQGSKNAESRYASMPIEQRQKSRAADAMMLNKMWVTEQRQVREASLKTIAAAVEAYRINHKITLVLNQDQVVAIDKHVDISKNIIDQLRGIKINYGPLPIVTLKEKVEKNNKSAQNAKK